MVAKFPPSDATREEIDRFFGAPPPVQPAPSYGSRAVLRVSPAWQYMADLHHTIDEIDALEAR